MSRRKPGRSQIPPQQNAPSPAPKAAPKAAPSPAPQAAPKAAPSPAPQAAPTVLPPDPGEDALWEDTESNFADTKWDRWPAVAEGDLGAIPTATEIRRYTRQAARVRAHGSIGSLLSDVYYAVVVVGIGIGLALGGASLLRSSLPTAVHTQGVGVSLPAVVLVLIGVLTAMLVSLAARLGPIGSEGAETAWWLVLPVERAGLIRPAARRLPIVAGVVAGTLVALLVGGLLEETWLHLVQTGLGSALVAASVVLIMALAQSLGSTRRTGAIIGDALLAVGPLALTVMAWVGFTPQSLAAPNWWVLGGLTLTVVALAVLVDRRLNQFRARSLRESGSVTAQAVGAVVSLDSRELGRALSDGAATARRRYSSALRTARGPMSALVTADLVLLRRSLRHLVQILVAAAVPALMTVVPQLSGQSTVLLAVLIGGYAAASASAEGARRAEIAPILDRLLPLDPGTVRRLRMVVPGLVMTLWALLTFTAVGWWLGDVSGWLILGLAGVPAWAAAAVRAAYRPAPDWGSGLVPTPFGAVPTGVGAVLARGPDVVVLGLLSTWVALILGSVSSTFVLVQMTLSVIAVMVASSTSTKSFTERMLDASKEAEAERRRAEQSSTR